jgi:hypothetical protein
MRVMQFLRRAPRDRKLSHWFSPIEQVATRRGTIPAIVRVIVDRGQFLALNRRQCIIDWNKETKLTCSINSLRMCAREIGARVCALHGGRWSVFAQGKAHAMKMAKQNEGQPIENKRFGEMGDSGSSMISMVCYPRRETIHFVWRKESFRFRRFSPRRRPKRNGRCTPGRWL